MESKFGLQLSGFAFLLQRLLELVNRRIYNGEFTERGLARLIGVSQPQVHNILKGARGLSPETADRFLVALNVSVIDLIEAPDPFSQGNCPTGGAPLLPPRKKPAVSALHLSHSISLQAG